MDYPKAKYRLTISGEQGDQVGNFVGGRHSYVSAVVETEEDEAALGPEWHDFPDMTDRAKPVAAVVFTEAEAPKRGPGRPPKPRPEISEE